MGNLYLEAPASYKNKEFAIFNLKEGNIVKGSIALYPAWDDPTVDWGTSMIFVGSNNSGAANIYANLYAGYNGTKNGNRARDMNIVLSGNVAVNLFSGSSNYVLGLSANSRIYSSNYKSGYYAKIVPSTGTQWGFCKMASSQYYHHHRKKLTRCQDVQWEKTDYYISCSVDKSGNKKTTSTRNVWQKEGSKQKDCGRRDTFLKSDCHSETERNAIGAQYFMECADAKY